MGQGLRRVGGLSVATGAAACLLAACRSILGIDPLPPLDDASAVATADAGEGGTGPGDGAADSSVPGDGAGEGGCDPAILLIDPDNCGACGHRCCGGACVDGGCVTGTPRVLENGSTAPSAVALDPDGTSVYWTHAVDGGFAVVRLDKRSSAAAATTVATGLGYVDDMQVAAGAIVVSTAGGGVLTIAPKTGGGTPSPVATGALPEGLALAGGQVYWADWGGGAGQGTVSVANLDGTGRATLYSGRSSPQGLAVAGGVLAWSEFDQGHDVMIGTTDGGAATAYTTDPSNSAPGPLALLDGGLLWGDIAQGGVWRLDLADGGQPQRIASGAGGITAIAVDATYVYWFLLPNGGSGSLSATTFDGSRTVHLADNLPCPVAIAADGQCLYWVNAGTCDGPFSDYQPEAGTGSVMSMERPP